MKKKLIIFATILLILCCLTMVACAEGESPVQSISFSTLPVTEYYRGDVFNYNNATLTVYYENGKVDTVALDPSMISAFDSQKIGVQSLTVNYGGQTTHVEVTVSHAPIYSISVVDGNYKKEYVQGQSLDIKNMFVNAVYVNGYSEQIAVTESMVEGFDTTQTGNRQFMIVYGGMQTTCEISVSSKSISGIEIQIPDKRQYVVGEKIDFTGAQLFVSYNNNTSEYINIVNGEGEYFDQTNFSVSIAGETTDILNRTGTVYITCTYFGFVNEFFVTVDDVKATAIELTQPLADQPKGIDEVDLSSSKVRVSFNNGTSQEYELIDSEVTIEWQNFDKTKNGEYTVTLKCHGLSIDASIKVIEPISKELIVDTGDAVYYRDGGDIDVTEWTYKVLLTNGKYRAFDEQGRIEASVTSDMLLRDDYDFGTEKAGNREYVLKYNATDGQSLTTTVTVVVEEKILSSISNLVLPERRVYKLGETIDLEGGIITVEYNDGTKKTVDLTSDMLDSPIADYTANVGSVKVDFTFIDAVYPGELSFGYDITVLKVATKLTLNVEEVDLTYVLGEEFDKVGLVATVTYEDETTSVLTDFVGEEWIFDGIIFDEVGEKKVRVWYGHKSHGVYADIDVVVTNNVVELEFCEGFVNFGEVTEGLDIVLNADMQLIVTRENGEVEEVVITNAMLDYNKNDYTIGQRDVTVTYETQLVVSVVSVISRKISSVQLTTLPEKTVYVKDDTDLLLAGIGVSVLYNNGMELIVTDSMIPAEFTDSVEGRVYNLTTDLDREISLVVSELDPTLGEDIFKTQTVDVKIKDIASETDGSCQFDIEIFKAVVNKISFSSSPIVVFEREELVLPADATINVTYIDNTVDTLAVEDIFAEDYSIKNFKTNEAGLQSITFQYLHKECTFNVEVLGKKLVDIELDNYVIEVVEGMAITSENLTIQAHFVKADDTEYSPEYWLPIDFNNVACTYDMNDVTFPVGENVCSQEHKVAYGGIEKTIIVEIKRKEVVSLTVHNTPQLIYVEGDADLNLAGGQIMVTYDNHTSEIVDISGNRVTVNKDKFDTSELYNGSNRQAEIVIEFEDEAGRKAVVSYYVTIKDRHYLRTEFDTSVSVQKYSFEYGTGMDERPSFTVFGHRTFNGDEEVLVDGYTYETLDDSNFKLYYEDAAGNPSEDWPKDVGLYTMVIEFLGDDNNNPYENREVAIEIVPRKIAVHAENKELVFGSIHDAIVYGWRTSLYNNNNGVESYPDGESLLYGEQKGEVVEVAFSIKDKVGREYDFFTSHDGKRVVNLSAGEYVIVPTIDTQLSDNYTIESCVNAVLNITKKDIKIEALDSVKTYGEEDARFDYNFYDVEGNLIGGKNAQYNGVVQLYEGCVDDISQYTLQRTDSKNENVGEYDIIPGAEAFIPNYNVAEFVSATLTINKKDISLVGTQITTRKYGEKFEGELWRNEYGFALEEGESLCLNDEFSVLFAELIDYKIGFENGNLSITVNGVDGIAPLTTDDAGDYRIEVSIIGDIATNYTVSISAFDFTIDPMDVLVEIDSEFISYVDYSALGEEHYKTNVQYDLIFGNNFDEDNAVLPVMTFAKETGNNVGRYELTIATDSIVANPNYSFSSRGDFGTAWTEYFANDGTLAEIFDRLPAIGENEGSRAYLVVVPSSFDFGYEGSETYARKRTIFPVMNIYGAIAGDGEAIKDAFNFGFVNKTTERTGLGYYPVDGYNGNLAYNYFANEASVNYVANSSLNDMATAKVGISKDNYVAIYTYVLNGIKSAEEILYSEKFDYEIVPAVISAIAINESYDYTGSVYAENGANAKGIAVAYSADRIVEGDVLNIVTDVQVKYYNRADYEKGEFIREAGEYVITISDIGNYNYALDNESANYECRFVINTIKLDICITNATDIDGVLTVSDIYRGRAHDNTMDNNWIKPEVQNSINGYFSTSTQKIVNATSMTTPPNNLRIMPYQEIDGVTYTPVNAGTYDFRWSVNAEYINYSVRFVREVSSGTYEECEYKYVIDPKEVNILNIERSGVNVKSYDGEAPAIKDKSKLVIDGSIAEDRVTKDDINFIFKRDMDYVPSELRGLITEEDMTSAGYFTMEVVYSKSNNYVFILDATHYIIRRNKVEITLNNSSIGYSLTKQYDTYAPSATLAQLKTASAMAITDEVYIDLDVKYYRQNSTDEWATYDPTGNNPKGMYAYDFKTYFMVDGARVDEATVSEEIFSHDDTVSADNYGILSWNYYYYFSVDYGDTNGCDGVYNVIPKDIYVTMPDSYFGNYTVGMTKEYYIHNRTYNGQQVTLATAQSEINDGLAKYTVSDVDKNEISVEDLDRMGFVRGNIILSGNPSIMNADEYFIADVSDIVAKNGNFNVKNRDILYMIDQLEVELDLTYVNSEGNSEKSYGDEDTTTKVFSFANPDKFMADMSLAEANIEEWLSYDIGDFENNKFIAFSNTFAFLTVDGDVISMATSKGMDAGTYYSHIGTIYAANFNIVVNGIEFNVLPKTISVNSAQRDYFDMESMKIDYAISSNVNKTLEDRMASEILACFVENEEISTLTSNAGDFNSNGYYIYALAESVNAIIDKYPNYAVNINSVRPNNYNSTYYYIPLTVNKLDIEVTVESNLGGRLTYKYGQVLTTADYKFVFSGFPALSTGMGYDYLEESTKQQNVKNSIVGTKDGDGIIDINSLLSALIAQNASVEAYKLRLISYCTDSSLLTDGFENYNVVLEDFEYLVNKRILELSIINNAGTNYREDGSISIIAGERDKLVYSETETGRMNYHFSIDNPEEIVGFDKDVHVDVKSMLALTWEGNILPDDYATRVTYTITQNGSNTLTAGRCQMQLSDDWYRSTNYVYQSNVTDVMYYPVVRSIGSEDNEIPYSAISLSGVQSDYKNSIINNLSMYVNVAYNGMPSDKEYQWVDIRKGLDNSNYVGIEHNARWEVAFVEEPAEINIGSEVKLTLTFEERFFGEEARVITSKEFLVRVYGTSDTLVKTKAESDFTFNNSGVDTLSKFNEQKSVNGIYYLTEEKDSLTPYNGMVDNIYSEFLLGVKENDSFSYEMILFDNGNTRLVLGFKGGTDFGYYARIIDVPSNTVLSKKTITTYAVNNSDGTTTERSILSDVSLFDSRRHKINVFIDKIGYLAYDEAKVNGNVTEVPHKYRIVFVLDDSYSYQIDLIGGKRMVTRAENGDAYTYTYEYTKLIDFSTEGKVGFVVNNCTAFIGNYTLKTMGVKLDNSGNVRDVRLWPIDNGSIVYIYGTTLSAIEDYVSIITINSGDGYSDKTTYRYEYKNALTGQIFSGTEEAEHGLYQVKLYVDVDGAEVYNITFYIALINTEGDSIVLVDNNDTAYNIYPDMPVEIVADSGVGLISSDRINAINYTKVRFDHVRNSDGLSTVQFRLKFLNRETGISGDLSSDIGLFLDFISTDEIDAEGNRLYTAFVSMSDKGSVWRKTAEQKVALEGIQNILEVRYDYTNGTILIRLVRNGEELLSFKVRRNFVDTPSIAIGGVQSVIGAPGSTANGGYSGIYFTNATLKLHEYQVSENRQTVPNLMYIENGDLSGTGSPADIAEINGKSVILADSQGMALATVTKNTYLRFRALEGTEFSLMFANNTPYFFSSNASATEELSGERGGMLIVSESGIKVSFYKYKTQWYSWPVSNMNLMDNKEHSIILSISEDIFDEGGIEYYRLTLVVDGEIINNSNNALRIPVDNDCNDIMSSTMTTGDDPEASYAVSRDYHFLPATRYVGIIPGNGKSGTFDTKLVIEELFVF